VPPRGIDSQRGYSLIELLLVVGITTVVGAVAVPMMSSTVANLRLQGDARSLAGAVSVTKLRAASNFSQARLFIDLNARSYHIETWQKTGTPGWVAEGGSTTLSSGVTFGFGAVTTPPPNTQAVIAQSTPCVAAVTGMNIRRPVQDLTLAEWRQVLDTNLTSAFLASRAAYPIMKRGGGGKIINIGSMLSIFGASFAAAYAASKGGIVQMSKALACAWAKDNIQVNAILPGWIDTPLTQSARKEVPGLNERVLARTPAGRWGEPQDLAGVAVFLASPASDFITGAAIPVDGGYSSQV